MLQAGEFSLRFLSPFRQRKRANPRRAVGHSVRIESWARDKINNDKLITRSYNLNLPG